MFDSFRAVMRTVIVEAPRARSFDRSGRMEKSSCSAWILRNTRDDTLPPSYPSVNSSSVTANKVWDVCIRKQTSLIPS